MSTTGMELPTEFEGNQESAGKDENVCSCMNENVDLSASLTIIISLVIVAVFAIVGLIMFVWIRRRDSSKDNNHDDTSSSKYQISYEKNDLCLLT